MEGGPRRARKARAISFKRSLGLLGTLVLGLCTAGGSASAAVPFVDIGAPSGPLTRVAVGTDLSCQAQHTGDTSLEFFPPAATPGDCGTFLAVGGVLFTPDFGNHDRSATSFGSATPFSAGGQGARTGAGTASNPFKVVTNATAGSTGLTLAQTDTYISGQESYRTDVAVRNGGGSPQAITLYRAGDCYLQNSDTGFGFAGGNGAVGCSATANNTPPGRIEEWVPITPGANFLEARFGDVWSAISAQTPFANQCSRCTENLDNGAGISWSVTLQPGQSTTFSHYTTFSPTGRAGPPPTTPTGPTDLEAARRPSCLSVPSVVRNVVARVPGVGTVTLKTRQIDDPARPLRLALSLSGGGTITSATFTVNGVALQASTGARPSASVGVGSLLIGSRFRNRVVANVVVNNAGRARLTQKMVILRCHVPATRCKRQAGGRKLRCTSRTPLAGRRVRVTVTRSSTETATGSASVSRGRYTVTVSSRTQLGAGTYAYKAIVRTRRRGERFQMIRLVTVT
jgi:hypothetical protein